MASCPESEEVATGSPAQTCADAGWAAWMVLAQAGDQQAYRLLLGEVGSWLRRYFARRLPHSLVDDVAQETLIAIHEKRHTYDPSRPFGPWLAAIARYKWIDRLRSLKHNAAEDLNEHFAVPDHAETATSIAVLDRLLAALKPAQSRVIRLVKIYGLSIEEASRHTGQSAALVKVNIHRGLARLSAIARKEADA